MAARKKGTADVAVGFCLDESGSMSTCWTQTMDGFNQYIAGLRGQDGATTVTLTKFSQRGVGGHFRIAHNNTPVADVATLDASNYQPGGNTPLYDAIGHTVTQMDAYLQPLVPRPSPIVVIQTDGFENASVDWTRERIVALIQAREADGWVFVYLGAEQDDITAERVSTGMGMSAGASMAYASAQTDSAFSSLADATVGVRSASVAGRRTSSADYATSAASSYQQRTTPSPVPTPPQGTAPAGWTWSPDRSVWMSPDGSTYMQPDA